MTREEAEILVGTLIACVNEAHAAVSAGWRDSCWNAVDAAERQVVLALVGVQPAPSVPDGWKLVPIEPTTEMICEMERQWFYGSQIDMAKREWKAACAAAPEAKCPDQ